MGRELDGAARALVSRLEHDAREPPAEVGTRGSTRLTVGIATYDDFDGAFFTVSSLLLHHAEAMAGAEILLLDNHPRGRGGEALAALARNASRGTVPVRYVPYEKVTSTAVRDVLFRHASGEIVVVLDTHVLLAPGALRAVADYFGDPAHAADLVQGPMLADDGIAIASTHMDPRFSSAMYGVWSVDPRGADPDGEAFDIPSQGLAAFAIRREAWPGINPRFRGFGGEEGYLHEKVRQRGGRTVCLPAFRWLHRFARPAGVPYELRYHDRLNNYLVGWTEIGYDLDPVYAHFEDALGAAFPGILEEVREGVYAPLSSIDMTAVLISAGRVAPWIRSRAMLSEIGRPAQPFSSAGGADSYGGVVADIIDDAWERGSHGVLVLDDLTRLSRADLHALDAVLADSDAACVQVRTASEADAGPGVVILRDISTLKGRVDELRPLHDEAAVHRMLGVEPVRVRVPVGRGDGPLPQLSAGFVPEAFPGGTTGWLESYRGYASLGWGNTVHGVRFARSRRQPVTLRDLVAAKLSPGAELAPGLLLFSEPGLWFVRGAAGVLARALAEAEDDEWDVMDLGSLGGVDRAPGDLAVGAVRDGPSGAAFLLADGARDKLSALLTEEPGDISEALASAAARGVLRIRGVWPPIVARPDSLFDAEAPVGMDSRYERFGHDG